MATAETTIVVIANDLREGRYRDALDSVRNEWLIAHCDVCKVCGPAIETGHIEALCGNYRFIRDFSWKP